MEDNIRSLQERFTAKIENAKSLKELDELFLELFGKNGIIAKLTKDFPNLKKEERSKIGPLFNSAKSSLESSIERRRQEVREQSYQELGKEEFDLNASVKVKKRVGYLHPLTEFEDKIAELFQKLGFSQFDGPQIDSDLNNFELLNIPPDHPARDMWDTLYINSHLLLRTHTSNSQIHIMKKYKPPIRMMVIGRCFRYENLTPKNDHTFDQFEIVYVDKKVNMGNLQYLSEYFLKAMLGEDIKARLSPGYYPFTEPSAHMFGTCIFCKGGGCRVCAQTGELELAGAGMIHPQVLKNCGIDPEEYSGIAWGVGPARMAMLKYNINDIRLFNSGDLKFLTNLRKGNKS